MRHLLVRDGKECLDLKWWFVTRGARQCVVQNSKWWASPLISDNDYGTLLALSMRNRWNIEQERYSAQKRLKFSQIILAFSRNISNILSMNLYLRYRIFFIAKLILIVKDAGKFNPLLYSFLPLRPPIHTPICKWINHRVGLRLLLLLLSLLLLLLLLLYTLFKR